MKQSAQASIVVPCQYQHTYIHTYMHATPLKLAHSPSMVTSMAVLVASGAVTDRPMSATSTCGATAAAAACQRQAGDQGCLAPTRRSSVRAGRCAQKALTRARHATGGHGAESQDLSRRLQRGREVRRRGLLYVCVCGCSCSKNAKIAFAVFHVLKVSSPAYHARVALRATPHDRKSIV